MSVVNIPKDPEGFRKSFVDPKPAWGRSHGEVWIRCKCGLCIGLHQHPTEGHVIAADGMISPSLHHDDPKCGFHVMGKLLDYTT